MVGWGPRNGYVYQKAFVEFFVGEEEVRRLERRVGERGRGEVDLLACNYKVRALLSVQLGFCEGILTDERLRGMMQDDLRTNVAEGERNAVTWGVFPGQEIVQSTIIERESFLAWKVRLPPLLSFSRLLLRPPSCLHEKPSLIHTSPHTGRSLLNMD